MLRTSRILLPLAVVLALVPAAGASAATLRFSGTFEAERTVKWDQPRGISHSNCQGGHYLEASGSETWKVKTRKPVDVTIHGSGKRASWTFGDPLTEDLAHPGVEAAGMRTREWRHQTGTTGGWCGGGQADPPLENDCGTLLPTYRVQLSAGGGSVEWKMSTAPEMRRERTDFYKCTLVAPSGFFVHSFPRVPAKVNVRHLFDRRKKTITITASKTFGPESQPLEQLGVSRTTSGTITWTLTLKRKR